MLLDHSLGADHIGEAAEVVALEVTDPQAVANAAAAVERRFGRLDVLVNNAAIHYDRGAHASKPAWTMIREAFEPALA